MGRPIPEDISAMISELKAYRKINGSLENERKSGGVKEQSKG